jgi:hypothetical protein
MQEAAERQKQALAPLLQAVQDAGVYEDSKTIV